MFPPVGPEQPTQYAVNFAPYKFRDVWWCFIVNEPGIIHWKHPEDVPYCPLCKSEGNAQPYRDGKTREVFDDLLHTFICHIRKPVKAKEYAGEEEGTH
jgi:hypothetical protein